MKNTAWRGAALSAAFLLGFLGTAAGQTPAPVPPKTTIWNYFGIPQVWDAHKDAHLNRLGNNPERERVPPLTKIADPANLKSPNPAIKTAAKIKADSDLVPQKIKAIKYLGTVACCCPANKDKIKAALVASLSDCNAGVRQAAAEAICGAAGNPCSVCNTCSCCSADVMNKLAEMAEGKTPSGCWTEPAVAVRAAAANALASCQRVRKPTPAPPGTPPLPGAQPVPLEERAPLTPPPAPAASPTPTPTPVEPKPQLLEPPPAAAKPSSASAESTPAMSMFADVPQDQGGESGAAGYAEVVQYSNEPARTNTMVVPAVEHQQLKSLPVSFAPEIALPRGR